MIPVQTVQPRRTVGALYELYTEQWVPRPPTAVFPFFCDPHNLERLTPPLLRFAVRATSTPTLAEGTVIDYTLRLHGLPVRWRTRIEQWMPPRGFTDVQLRGPYALWRHTHHFVAERGGTRLTDHVRYRLPLGWLGVVLAGRWVTRDVGAIFAYRRRVIAEVFGGDATPSQNGKVTPDTA